jgi:predicted HTH domain antitoxin
MGLPANAKTFYGEDAEAALHLRAAMMGYQLGELTSTQAAELAGISRVAFIERLGEFGIPLFNLTREEYEHDRDVLREATGL